MGAPHRQQGVWLRAPRALTRASASRARRPPQGWMRTGVALPSRRVLKPLVSRRRRVGRRCQAGAGVRSRRGCVGPRARSGASCRGWSRAHRLAVGGVAVERVCHLPSQSPPPWFTGRCHLWALALGGDLGLGLCAGPVPTTAGGLVGGCARARRLWGNGPWLARETRRPCPISAMVPHSCSCASGLGEAARTSRAGRARAAWGWGRGRSRPGRPRPSVAPSAAGCRAWRRCRSAVRASA